MPTKQAKSGAVDDVVRTLQRCPKWTRIAPREQGRVRDEIIACLQKLSRLDTDVLRAAERRFLDDSQRRNAASIVDDFGTLFLLNRYIFKVPEKEDAKKAKFFGGWAGVPQDGTYVNVLWPFALTKGGNLELIGTFHGYNGDDFAAIEEFDYFNSRFGRRKVGR